MRAVAAILGSAFAQPPSWRLEPVALTTPYGPWTLHRLPDLERPAWVSFRHGLPHALLPHQIPWRAQASALRQVGCGALLVTSSAGVLDPALPLGRPIRVGDLLMPDNRLSDGTACTMWPDPHPEHGHLVWDEGPISAALDAQLDALCPVPLAGPATFAYQLGPRIKTAAENRWWRQLGAQVNSMTLGPELVLAAELEIPCAAVVVGHKPSGPHAPALKDHSAVAETLRAGRGALEALVDGFLGGAEPVEPGNHVFRFHDPRELSGWLDAAGFRPVGPALRLAGGFLNQVWRVPGVGVVKHAPPFVASQPDLPLDPARSGFEARALRALDGWGCSVRAPRLLHFDEAAATLVLEDLGDLPTLGEALDRAELEALGAFLGALHTRRDPELPVALANDAVQRTRHELQYAAATSRLRDAGERQADEVGARLKRLGLRLQQPGSCWIMGDLWPPSVLVADDGLRVIDWELSHWGHPAQDLAHLGAHLWLLDAPEAWDRFLAGYRAAAPPEPEDMLETCALHFAAELLMRALGPFRQECVDVERAVRTAVDHVLGEPTWFRACGSSGVTRAGPTGSAPERS